MEAAVAALDRDLRAVGSRLIIRHGDPVAVVPAVASEVGATIVRATREHTPYARARDRLVAERVGLHLHDGALLVEPAIVGETRLFAAFHRRWLAIDPGSPLPAPERLRPPPADVVSEPPPRTRADGAAEASRRLHAFAAGPAAHYGDVRDRLDLDGTSRVGADLHVGALSPRQVWAAVGSFAFRRQLAWRDWAHHVLWFRPGARRAAWRHETRDLPWREDAAVLAAWREGRTGYPAVDAAMRQLATTGWINNRARMIVASFLSKDLLVDWRHGEAYFLDTLVDADVANNSLGWQWTAGVGTDAAPFHRMFNPVLQGERFDPAGTWVRTWVPELAHLPAAFVHRPWESPGGTPAAYPHRLVEHGQARLRAIDWFRAHAATRR
jgi:deoxyribodipyrimidine photo-lyase